MRESSQDMQVRMHGLPAATRGRPGYRLALSRPDNSTTLEVKPLISVGQRIDQALDIVDVSRYTGDPKNASFIAGQLRLLLESIREAGMFLRGGHLARTSWSDDPVDPMVGPIFNRRLALSASRWRTNAHLGPGRTLFFS